MPSRKRSTTRSIATKSAELAFATPLVVAHRLARMAMSGPIMSARDRKELHLMGTEKATAFAESWNAMALQTFRLNQEIAARLFYAFWQLPSKRFSSAHALAQLQSGALSVLREGIAPIHRKATANAKRLSRTKLR